MTSCLFLDLWLEIFAGKKTVSGSILPGPMRGLPVSVVGTLWRVMTDVRAAAILTEHYLLTSELFLSRASLAPSPWDVPPELGLCAAHVRLVIGRSLKANCGVSQYVRPAEAGTWSRDGRLAVARYHLNAALFPRPMIEALKNARARRGKEWLPKAQVLTRSVPRVHPANPSTRSLPIT